MSDMDYTFAVARVRAMEVSLFSKSTIDQLMGCKTYEACMNFLQERGWGDGIGNNDLDQILAAEKEKVWTTVEELKVPMEVFDVLSIPNEFQNLKVALKEAYLKVQHDDFYLEGTKYSREELREMVQKKEFDSLPADMAEAATESFEVLLRTGDGQLCDMILDRGALTSIRKAAEKSGEEVIQEYARIIVATADMKVAYRCIMTGKSRDFMIRALAPCEGLDVVRMAERASEGLDAFCDYLKNNGYGEAADSLMQGASAFERWCDNYLIEMMQPQKYNAFSVGPVVAYVLARENEIKTVGIIVTGKANGLSEESIKERIREMYV